MNKIFIGYLKTVIYWKDVKKIFMFCVRLTSELYKVFSLQLGKTH